MAAVTADGGWSWLVCIGTFIATFLEIGMVKALGVLLPILREQCATQTWIIGFIISFVPGFGAVTCPMAGALSKRFSARYIVMIFNTLSALGLMFGSVAVSIPMLSLSFLLTGFSIGAEAIVIGELATYFHVHYSIANAIAQAGISVGVMVMPLLTQFFLGIYGWRGAMLLLAGIKLHSIISGALLKPIRPSLLKPNHYDSNGVDEKMTLTVLARESKLFQSYQIVSKDEKLTQQTKYYETQCGLKETERGCVCYLDDDYHGNEIASNDANQHRDRLMSRCFYFLDLALFKDANFVSIIAYSIGNGYCLAGWLIYLVPYSLETGLEPFKASSLATFGGVGNLLGNAVFPVLIRLLHSNHVLYIGSFTSFVALFLNPMFSTMSSYIGLVMLSITFGCGRGAAILAFYQNCKESLGEHQMTNAVMWIHVSYSIGALTSGFISGWIFDETGSYTMSFYILGGIALASVCPKVITDLRKS